MPSALDNEVCRGVKIAIDRGGTFTDVLAVIPGQEDLVFKLLSVDPTNYQDANIEAIRRVLSHVRDVEIPRAELLDTAEVESIRLGTTVATNALLERKGSRCALLVTKGFRDVLRIGDQTRPKLFDLNVRKPGVLYEDVVEVEERVTLEAYTEDPDGETFHDRVNGTDVVLGKTGEVVRILTPLDEETTRASLHKLYGDGFESIGVCLTHGYNYQEHERRIGEIAQEIGFKHISLSHALLPIIKLVHRGQSTTADAYLTPTVKEYISTLLRGFREDFTDHTCLEMMQSDGGLVSHEKFNGLRAVLSGPAGGVVGFARTCFDEAEGTPVIGFDMGGTSTDVSRFGGIYEHITNSVTAGVHISCPQLDINTVAAGGGSILSFRNGLFVVGPESASAHPGPACYRKGGPLTVTDANLLVGRILPEYFPKIFGPNENEPLDTQVVQQKFDELTRRINHEIEGQRPEFTPEEVAMGFLQVANLNMSKPIRQLTEARGFDVTKHNLASFGGAGGQHACDMAVSLGISRIIIHKYSSILSAYGMALADIAQELQEPCSLEYGAANHSQLTTHIKALSTKAVAELERQGLKAGEIRTEVILNMRYRGSESQLMTPIPEGSTDFGQIFAAIHAREYGFTSDRPVLVDDIRVRASGSRHRAHERSPFVDFESLEKRTVAADQAAETRKAYFGNGWRPTPVFQLDELQPGNVIQGPAIIIDNTQTLVVIPNATATVLHRHVVVDLSASDKVAIRSDQVDPIQLAVFGNRFMAIAEDMGRTLQKVAVSTNVKERLDFSCAIFDADGGLTANAPHVPVHLGSMSSAVRIAKDYWKGNLFPGDVIATNHPLAGGTHLPDVTLIAPVFDPSGDHIDFFVASRAHHAEIGGIAPGSMPSNSTELYQEGAAFEQWKIVSKGEFDDAGVLHHFMDVPGSYPGCSPSRRISDNIADLKAQIAANQKGRNLIEALFREYNRKVVLFYMKAVKRTAEAAVRGLLRSLAAKYRGQLPLSAVDHMDDGSTIALKVSIDEGSGSAVFDFTGTGLQTLNCLNAPPAITASAVLYSLRCMIGIDIPLNEGCLAPISLVIPSGTLLNPSGNAAVCAGNGCTSQRITDVVLKTLRACAASHGCTNILSFGRGGVDAKTGKLVPGFGYGETIAGGTGAGLGWHGYSGSQVHMTNTRMTDPEILEKRYPVVLRRFTLRPNSGGEGRWRGGDGCVRELEFTSSCHASILSQRRVYQPYGMAGGKPGQKGQNFLGRRLGGMDKEERQWINIGGTKEVDLRVGDRIMICTPGGGGYGLPAHDARRNENRTGVDDTLLESSDRDLDGPVGPAAQEYWPRANGTIAAYVNAGLASA